MRTRWLCTPSAFATWPLFRLVLFLAAAVVLLVLSTSAGRGVSRPRNGSGGLTPARSRDSPACNKVGSTEDPDAGSRCCSCWGSTRGWYAGGPDPEYGLDVGAA